MPPLFEAVNRSITRREGPSGLFSNYFQSYNAPTNEPNVDYGNDFFGVARRRAREADVRGQARDLQRARSDASRGAASYEDIERLNKFYAFDEEASGRADLNRSLNDFFVNPYMQGQERYSAAENRFFDELYGDVDLSQVIAGLTAASQGAVAEAGKPGGAIDQAWQQAASGATESGFGVGSGTYQHAGLNVLGRLNDTIASLVAQQAPALYSTAVQNRLGSLGEGGAYLTNAMGRQQGLRESIFTGRTNIEALRMAQRQMAESSVSNREALKLQRKAAKGGGVGGLVGGWLGTAVGSLAGGVGAVAGKKLGESLFSSKE